VDVDDDGAGKGTEMATARERGTAKVRETAKERAT